MTLTNFIMREGEASETFCPLSSSASTLRDASVSFDILFRGHQSSYPSF